MDNPAQVTDLVARFRPISEEERPGVQDLLDDAWAILVPKVNEVTDLDQRVSSGRISVETVKAVVKAMVLRVLRNPNGFRQFTSDDASYVRDNAVSGGLLYLADDELALLTGIPVTQAGAVPHLSFSSQYQAGHGYGPGRRW